MEANSGASRTALGAARHRALHQILESGSILRDPLAVPIVGEDKRSLMRKADDRLMRWFICARSRYAERVLAVGVAAGVDQLVVLGAGLDTFAYRNPHPHLTVVEIDHRATQAWKLGRLEAAGIAVPPGVRHVTVDFERDSLADVLPTCVDPARAVLCWWLGVTPYLTRAAVTTTLGTLAALPHSAVVLDHAAPLPVASWMARRRLAKRREHVARLGEPWLSEYTAEEITGELTSSGFTDVRAVDEGALIRGLLGFPPATEPRPTHLAVAARGWPAALPA